MRIFLSIIALLICVYGNAQIQGKQYAWTMNSVYSTGTKNGLISKPGDSAIGTHPLIIFLHGNGGIGSDPNIIADDASSGSIPYICKRGASMRFFSSLRSQFRTFYVVSPQCPTSGGFRPHFIKDAYYWAVQNLPNVDTTQVFLTGLSFGGGGVFEFMADSIQWVRRIVAIAPMCGITGGGISNRDTIKTNMDIANTQLWAFHGTNDIVVNVSSTMYYWAVMNNAAPSKFRFTWYSGGSHADGWNFGSDTGHTSRTVDSSNARNNFNFSSTATFVQNPNVFEWFLQYETGPPVNILPNVNAGADQTVYTPLTACTLTGTASDPDGTIISQLWTRVSGPNTPTITTPANLTTTVTGLIVGTYVFRLTATDDSSATNSDDVTVTVSAPPPPSAIPVKPVFYIDFSGYTPRDQNHPENGFDAHGYIDPKNSVTSFTAANAATGIKCDTSFFFPDKSYGGYFPNGMNDNTFYPPGINLPGNSAGGRGCRVILDFVGNTDWEDTTKQYTFSEFWGYNQTFNGNAKVYFYKIDTLMKIANRNTRALLLARPDSLMHPFDSLVTTTSPGTWISKVLTNTVNARYIMFRTVLNGDGKKAEFSEYVIYAQRTGDWDSAANAPNVRPQIFTGTLPSHKNSNYTFGKMNGSNYLNGIDTLQMVNTGPRRNYTGNSYFDTTNSLTYTHFYFWTSFDVGPLQLGNAKRIGKTSWYTNLGANAYQSNTFGNSGWNIDARFDEPEILSSYDRASNFQFNFTAKYGSVAVSSTLTQWVGDAGYPNGLNLVPVIEIGNEVWAHGGSDMADFMMSSRCYDSIKAADPNMPVMLAGTETYDTTKVQLFSFLSYVLRADHVFPGDWINHHKYQSNRDYLPIGQTFDYNLQVGMRSETPEAWMLDGMIPRHERIARRDYTFLNGDTSKRIVLTEAGIGNWGHMATTVGEASLPWDIYCSPNIGSAFDSLQAKAIIKTRYELLYPFSKGWYFYNDYAMMNNFGDPDNHPNLFSSYGSATDRAGSPPFNLRLFYPLWNYREAVYSRLNDYYPDEILVNGDTTNLWIVRYRKSTNTDSICLAMWIGSRSGRTLTSTLVNVGSINGNLQKLVPSFTSTTPTLSTKTVSSSSITDNFSEAPVLYFGLEGTSTGWPPNKWLRNRRPHKIRNAR